MTLDECDNAIARIRRTTHPAEACHALEPIFDYYEVMNIELGRDSVFWRARPAEASPFQSLKEMTYPPPPYAKLGRLNDDKSPCLYAATREETALLEIGAAHDSYVQLIGFKVKPSAAIRVALIGELLHVYRTGYVRLTGTDPDRTLNRYLNEKGLETGRRVLYIDAFLAHLLGDPEAKNQDYARTRALASMVYRRKEIEGIMFPSVPAPLGMNLALKPDSTDKNLHPVCCLHARISRTRQFGFIEFQVIHEAEGMDSDGKFVWTKAVDPSKRKYFNLTKQEYEEAKRRSV